MMTFDAPSREFCVSRRIRTNTPLQALVMLNDPVYVEASQNLARLARAKYENQPPTQINYMYRRALSNSPSTEQMNGLIQFYESTLEELNNIGEARAVLMNNKEDRGNEYLAMAQVANVIMNLDEFLMKS